MEIRDYISAAAFIISSMSLVIAMRSAGFSRHAKLVEIRATVLAKVSETSLMSSRLRRTRDEFLDAAKAESEVHAILDMPEIDRLENALMDAYAEFSKLPLEDSIQLYGRTFHKVSQVRDTVQIQQERLDQLKARYMRDSKGQ